MSTLDRTILTLLSEHRDLCLSTNGSRPLPERADELAFAVLLLASEHSNKIEAKEEVLEAIESSIDAVGENEEEPHIGDFLQPSDWTLADQFALILAKSLIAGEEAISFLDIPFRLLNHSQSQIRWFCFNSIWFYRKHAPMPVLDRLLTNVANTLGYVEHSLGLARSFFDTDEEFFDYADSFEPDSYEDQYCQRIEQVRKNPSMLHGYQNLFLPLECRVREIISTVSLGLATTTKQR